MARGRPPKPTALKVLEGTRQSRINEAEPIAARGLPEPPASFAGDADALAEWGRIVPLLDSMGVLSRADGAALAIYCRAHSRMIQAQADIAKQGLSVLSAQGTPKTNPACSVLANAEATCLKILASFGCDPSARSRVCAKDGRPVDAFSEFLKQRKAR